MAAMPIIASTFFKSFSSSYLAVTSDVKSILKLFSSNRTVTEGKTTRSKVESSD